MSEIILAVQDRIGSYENEQKAKIIRAAEQMPYRDLLLYLENEIEQSTRISNFDHRIHCFRDDGVYQLHRAIERVCGVSRNKVQKNPSGGERPMNTIDIELADGTRVKVPYGEIALPDMGEDAGIKIFYDEDSRRLIVRGNCEYRFSSMIDDIIRTARHLLNTDSIYRDMAIEIGSDFQPKRMDLSNIHNQFMVLSEEADYALRPLRSRILEPQKCIDRGIELKTGVLLEGVYGTGKTLLAFKLAQQAIGNNWSFIYLKDPTGLAEVLRLSKTLDNNGNGVIVFLEDVDQVTRGNRDTAMQDILNTLDGGDTKGMNVILIATTNHIELIEPTFLRGKRIGSIVTMGALNADTARLFIEHSFRDEDYVLETEGLDAICERIEAENIVPAFMAEIVDNVKANMIFEESTVVEPRFLDISLSSYLRQVGLAGKKDMSLTPEMALAQNLKTVLVDERVDVLQKDMDKVLVKFGLD